MRVKNKVKTMASELNRIFITISFLMIFTFYIPSLSIEYWF